MNNNTDADSTTSDSSPGLIIVEEAQPAREDVQWICNKLAAFNVAKAGGTDFQPLTILMRDDQGQMQGGLLGWTVWSWFHIDSLWVEEAHRKHGHGLRLLAAAEDAARNRGCTLVEVDTLSFQALGFYLKAGYTVFGTLSGIGGRFDRHYLKKTLRSQ